MDEREPVVVVAGGGYAGVLAANRLRGRLRDTARVLLISPGRHFVDRIRLHETAARGRNVERPFSRVLARGVEHVAASVVALDASASRIAFEIDGARHWLHYDALVLALGSRFVTNLPGAHEHAAVLSDPASAQLLAARIRTLNDGSRVAIVGGGLSAIELGAEIAEAHPRLRVELVTHQFAPDLAGPARDTLAGALHELGVRIREGCSAAGFRSDGVVLADGTAIGAELSVLAAGFQATPLGPEFGLPAQPDGRVPVDEHLRASGSENVFVAGDLAEPPAAAIGSGHMSTRPACATAMPLGAHAADQVVRLLSGAPLVAYSFKYMLRCISIGRKSGVVVFVDGDDRPTGRVIRGRAAALVKESICRFVIGALRIERIFSGAYAWPVARKGRGASGPARLPA